MSEVAAARSRKEASRMGEILLRVEDLKTYFFTRDGIAKAVDGVSYQVRHGETLGVVGESGCGKSVTAFSVLGLIPQPAGRIVGGRVLLGGRDLLTLSEKEMQGIRGNEISMIFQEPMTSLNPVMTIGKQISEAVILHQGLSRAAAMDRAMEMLHLVRIPDERRRLREYPHQLSGGMRQRVLIAMALACHPKLLIADEPTTALDVTIQAQILELMVGVQESTGTAIMYITHDLGVIAEMARRVVVMYAGRKVEEADVKALFQEPLHPYTVGLLRSMPSVERARTDGRRPKLAEIPGMVPLLHTLPSGCRFADRCPVAAQECRQEDPPVREHRPQHWVACWYPDRAVGCFDA